MASVCSAILRGERFHVTRQLADRCRHALDRPRLMAYLSPRAVYVGVYLHHRGAGLRHSRGKRLSRLLQGRYPLLDDTDQGAKLADEPVHGSAHGCDLVLAPEAEAFPEIARADVGYEGGEGGNGPGDASHDKVGCDARYRHGDDGGDGLPGARLADHGYGLVGTPGALRAHEIGQAPEMLG